MTRRLALIVGLVAALTLSALLPAGAAAAVGTGGVELSPQLPRGGDGRFLLELDPEAGPRTLVVRNLTDQPRQADVYAAAATMTDSGAVQLSGRDSAWWTGLEPASLELAPNAVERLTFTVDAAAAPGDVGHVAFVVELRESPSLVTQAASVVAVGPPLSPAPRWPWPLVAGALLALVTSGLVRELRTRRLPGVVPAAC